jgi:hypothetical protein
MTGLCFKCMGERQFYQDFLDQPKGQCSQTGCHHSQHFFARCEPSQSIVFVHLYIYTFLLLKEQLPWIHAVRNEAGHFY